MILDKLKDAKTVLMELSGTKTFTKKISLLNDLKITLAATVKDTKSTGVKKYLSRMHNKLDSLIGGLSTQDYTLNDMFAFRQAALNRIRYLIEHEEASPSDNVNRVLAGEEDEPSVFDDFEKETPEEKEDRLKREREKRYDEENQETIQKYANEGALLKALIGKNFILAKEPIIPIITPFSPSRADLHKIGFKTDQIGIYVILRSQIVLGINVRYAMEMKKKAKRTVPQLAEFLVRQLSRKSGVTYHIMGPSYQHKTGYYFWVLSDKNIRALKKATGTAKMVVSKWGFAF